MAGKAHTEVAIALTTEAIAHEGTMASETFAARIPIGRAGRDILADERDISKALDELQESMDVILANRAAIAKDAREYATIAHVHNLLSRLRHRCDSERRELTAADARVRTIVDHHDDYRQRLIERNVAFASGASLAVAEEVALV